MKLAAPSRRSCMSNTVRRPLCNMAMNAAATQPSVIAPKMAVISLPPNIAMMARIMPGTTVLTMRQASSQPNSAVSG